MNTFKKIVAAALSVATLAATSINASAYDTNATTCTTLGWKSGPNAGGYSYSSDAAIASYAELNYNDVMKATGKFKLPAYSSERVVAFFDKGTTAAQAMAMADKIQANLSDSGVDVMLEITEDENYNERYFLRAITKTNPQYRYNFTSRVSTKINQGAHKSTYTITVNGMYFPALKFATSNGCTLTSTKLNFIEGGYVDYDNMETVYTFELKTNLNMTDAYVYGTSFYGSKVKETKFNISATLAANKFTYTAHLKNNNYRTSVYQKFAVAEGYNLGTIYTQLEGTDAKQAINNSFTGINVSGANVYIYIGRGDTLNSGNKAGVTKAKYYDYNLNYRRLAGKEIQKVIDKNGFANVYYYDNCTLTSKGTSLGSLTVTSVANY